MFICKQFRGLIDWCLEMAEFHLCPTQPGVVLTPSNSRDELIKDGWFGETEAMWPGQKFSIQVEEVLLNGRSEFQV